MESNKNKEDENKENISEKSEETIIYNIDDIELFGLGNENNVEGRTNKKEINEIHTKERKEEERKEEERKEEERKEEKKKKKKKK